MSMILPPAVLGVMGSGQLGRMFAQSAIQMGYFVHCYSPDNDSPTEKVGAKHYRGDYNDFEKLSNFLSNIQVLTFEFENIPPYTLDFIEEYTSKTGLIVRPKPSSIRIAQNRILEKTFFKENQIPVTEFFPIRNSMDLDNISNIQFPCIVKTSMFGYDGKGQTKVNSVQEIQTILENPNEYIIEEIVPFQKELSVIIARFINGQIIYYNPSENIHQHHILDTTIHPAPVSLQINENAIQIAIRLVNALDYVGVLGLEFFLVGDKLLCNEFAPRPHNSGHFSMDAYPVSQFDLQVRTICDLPTMDNLKPRSIIMKNIIGLNLYSDRELLEKYLSDPNYKIHWYQKSDARKGRKMGHINHIQRGTTC